MDISKPLVLWDGDCGLCRRSVAWCKRQDARRRLDFMPYQEVPSPPMTPALYEACGKAAHVLLPDGGVLRAGRAALFVLVQGAGWPVGVFNLPPFIWAVELGYWIVATNRTLFSRLIFTRE